MARAKVRLDSRGIASIAKGRAMQLLMRAEASKVAQNVNARGLVAESAGNESGTVIRAEVEVDVTDRARAVVSVKHPAAEAMQAKYGLLTKAATQAGLKVKGGR